MLRRSRRLLTGSLLRLVVVLLVVLHGVTAATASAATRRMRGGSAVSSPLVSLHHRGLSLVSGRARDDEETKEEASGMNKKVEAVASPNGTGGRGGATGRALASEGASMTTAAAATKATSADKPTRNSATSAAATSDTEATAGNTTASSNSTHNSPSTPASSANSSKDATDALDDASGAIDDDTTGASPAHYSQWDVTNATDFDGMLRNQTYRGPGLLPPDDADPPPHWDVAMTALFAGLALLLCVGTAFRRYRNQQRQQRANYEPIHSITV
jgi:hypothetical protein